MLSKLARSAYDDLLKKFELPKRDGISTPEDSVASAMLERERGDQELSSAAITLHNYVCENLNKLIKSSGRASDQSAQEKLAAQENLVRSLNQKITKALNYGLMIRSPNSENVYGFCQTLTLFLGILVITPLITGAVSEKTVIQPNIEFLKKILAYFEKKTIGPEREISHPATNAYHQKIITNLKIAIDKIPETLELTRIKGIIDAWIPHTGTPQRGGPIAPQRGRKRTADTGTGPNRTLFPPKKKQKTTTDHGKNPSPRPGQF